MTKIWLKRHWLTDWLTDSVTLPDLERQPPLKILKGYFGTLLFLTYRGPWPFWGALCYLDMSSSVKIFIFFHCTMIKNTNGSQRYLIFHLWKSHPSGTAHEVTILSCIRTSVGARKRHGVHLSLYGPPSWPNTVFICKYLEAEGGKGVLWLSEIAI